MSSHLADPPPWLVPWLAWNLAGRLPSQRPSSAPADIPEWARWLAPWSAWNRSGRTKPRPSSAPARVPEAAWHVYGLALALARHEPPEPSNPLAGVGLFTAWDPAIILRRRPRAKWVAVTPDPFNGVPGCSPELAAELRKAGYELVAWESRSTRGPQSAAELGAGVWLGQAENAIEATAMMAFRAVPGVLCGAVGKSDGWTKDQCVGFAGLGWLLALEVYKNRMPWLVPDSAGVPVATFTYGLYDASSEAPGIGHRMPLAEYRAWLPASSWSGYTAETMTDADWHELGS